MRATPRGVTLFFRRRKAPIHACADSLREVHCIGGHIQVVLTYPLKPLLIPFQVVKQGT
jgi:hypothetical protein